MIFLKLFEESLNGFYDLPCKSVMYVYLYHYSGMGSEKGTCSGNWPELHV